MKRVALSMVYDDNTGELVKVRVSPHFARESRLMRADVMKDIRDKAESLYDEACLDLSAELDQISAKARARKAKQ